MRWIQNEALQKLFVLNVLKSVCMSAYVCASAYCHIQTYTANTHGYNSAVIIEVNSWFHGFWCLLSLLINCSTGKSAHCCVYLLNNDMQKLLWFQKLKLSFHACLIETPFSDTLYHVVFHTLFFACLFELHTSTGVFSYFWQIRSLLRLKLGKATWE